MRGEREGREGKGREERGEQGDERGRGREERGEREGREGRGERGACMDALSMHG